MRLVTTIPSLLVTIVFANSAYASSQTCSVTVIQPDCSAAPELWPAGVPLHIAASCEICSSPPVSCFSWSVVADDLEARFAGDDSQARARAAAGTNEMLMDGGYREERGKRGVFGVKAPIVENEKLRAVIDRANCRLDKRIERVFEPAHPGRSRKRER